MELKHEQAMKSLLAAILVPCVAATGGDVAPSFTSFAGDTKCIVNSTRIGAPADTNHVNYALDYNCDSLQVPSAWQKTNDVTKDGSMQYDLAIVGGGIGGAYLVSRLHEEFVLKRNLSMPKIALFERSGKMGGRLMSGYGPGGLNLGVLPMSHELYEQPLPMPEYGGMRVDPKRYPLVYNRIVYAARAIFGAGTCPIPGCDRKNLSQNCCPKMLTRMEVGDIRYVTTSDNASDRMRSSTVSNTSEKSVSVPKNNRTRQPYTLSDIAAGGGSPFDQCLQLVIAADAYYNVTGKYHLPNGTESKPAPADNLWRTSIDELCANCSTSDIAGMCKLCGLFVRNGSVQTQASAVISCTGYDIDDSTSSLEMVVGLAEEVTDTAVNWHLYLLNVGFQRFVMGLLQGPQWTEDADELVQLFRNRGANVAPQYGKQLSAVSVLPALGSTATQSTSELVERHIHGEPSKTAAGVALNFADGSSATAKSAYLTMLPYDLAALEGFQNWVDEYDKVLPDKSGAVKIVFGWTNVSEALGPLLNMSSCTEGLCERLILDGPADSWLVRQVWLWDPSTIMIYEIAPYNTAFPANRLAKMAREEGMDAMVKKCFKQIRKAVNLSEDDLKDPDWARLKTWPHGSLMPSWKSSANKSEIETFVNMVSRPLGDGVPLYYGNSEVARDGNNHGWMEGSLEMVEEALPDLMRQLGLNVSTKYNATDFSTLDKYASPPPPAPPPPLGMGTAMGTLAAATVVGVVVGVGIVHIHAVFKGIRGPLSSPELATKAVKKKL